MIISEMPALSRPPPPACTCVCIFVLDSVTVVLNYFLSLSAANIVRSGLKIGQSSLFIGPLKISGIADSWSLIFFSLLRLISSIVFIWSYYYMGSEEQYARFILIVILFVRSIVTLIFLCSLFGAIIGWDGLGVTSFLLVIYYKNRKSIGSGIITALTNRLGDCFFLVILGISLFRRESLSQGHFLVALILLVSMTKSAQIPFSSWLPSAMAAPTPVRALVHSSTLVTAGVYLLMRFNRFRFEWILPVGTATMLMAGFCACAEMDIKKIVALSTLSQLGVMIVSLSIVQKDFCFFHLITHAIFKALLFICVGVGIHSVYGSQDFRRFSGIRSCLAWPTSLLLVRNLSLLGFPFISGFYRKDTILERFYSLDNRFLMALGFLVGVGRTTSYRLKIINLAIFSKNSEGPSDLRSGGFSWQLKIPILTLGLCSTFRGFIISDLTSQSLFVSLVYIDKLLPLAMIRLGVAAGEIISNLKTPFLSSMWNLSPLFQGSRKVRGKMRISQKVDGRWVEFRGGMGSSLALSSAVLLLHPFVGVSTVMFWVLLV